MAFIITSDQEFPAAVTFTDDHGNPATIDGLPLWASSNDTILMVVAAADGMSAVISAVGPDGQAQISVTADTNMGAGTVPIIGTLDINVVSGMAAIIGITPGIPVAHTA
jgi:hypothetical protein